MYREYKGMMGRFSKPEEIGLYWYKEEDDNLEDDIERYSRLIERKKGELKENKGENRNYIKEEIKEYTKLLNGAKKDLDKLHLFLDDYTRCQERYANNKTKLKLIERDWIQFNLSLYTDYSDYMFFSVVGYDRLSKVEIKERNLERRKENIKREEIARRMRNLLQ